MKDLKHNKLRNPHIIFDVLVSMLVQESNASGTPPAIRLLRKYYTDGTCISKVSGLYKMLSEAQTVSSPDRLIDVVCESYKGIDKDQYNRELYQLNGDINKYYGKDVFYNMRVPKFRVYASIYKLLESTQDTNPLQYIQCRDIVREAITTVEDTQIMSETQRVVNSIEPGMRKIVMNLMVEKFNQKYATTLNKKQRDLLKLYVLNNSRSPEFVDYVVEEVGSVITNLHEKTSIVKDPVLKIKIAEVTTVLGSMISSKNITSEQVSGLMKCYSLIDELEK